MKLILAALLALSQTAPAWAQPDFEVPPSPPGASAGSRLSGGANLGSAQMYAYVDQAGMVQAAQSKGTVACAYAGGSCRASIGRYQVHFARDVRNCSIQATLGSDGAYSVGAYAISASSWGNTYPDTVLVAVVSYSVAGAFVVDSPSDRPFRVAVQC
jgi:hypothetical protein